MAKKFVKAFKENKDQFRLRVVRVAALVGGTVGVGITAAIYAKRAQNEVDENLKSQAESEEPFSEFK